MLNFDFSEKCLRIVSPPHFVFDLSRKAMELFQINIMVGIAGSNKCNAIVILSSNYWLKYFCKTVIYDMLWI